MTQKETYPLPQSNFCHLKYKKSDETIYLISQDDDGREREIPISTPFGIIARLRRADENDSSGLRIRVRGMNGDDREADIARRDLVKSGGQEIKVLLYDLGMRTYYEGEKHVIAFLKAVDPEQEIVMVSRRGWHELPDPIFVAPSGEVIGVKNDTKIELEIGTETETSGKFSDWKTTIEAVTKLDGVQHWRIAAAASFAGPIAQLCKLETSGIHFSGMTSRGKTIALRIATSAWSNPETGRGLLSLWRSTDNAFEASAAASNGTILALDEVKLANGKLVASTLFQLTSGTSKSRSNLKQTLQKRIRWTTFVLSSGEQSLKEKVQSDHGKWLPGMSVRFTDIDVTDVNSHVDKKNIDELLVGIQSNYGIAGPKFCEALVQSGLHLKPGELIFRIQETAKIIIGHDADGALLRAVMPLALIQTAGELAQEFGVLPAFDLAGAIKWAWNRYLVSADAASLDPDQNCIDALRDWIARNWEVSIKNLFDNSPPYRQADGWFDDNCIYILADQIVDAVGIGLKRAEIARVLDRHGLLKHTDGDRKSYRRMPGMPGVTVFCIDRTKMGPEPQKVVGG
jgi:hypothetical protein